MTRADDMANQEGGIESPPEPGEMGRENSDSAWSLTNDANDAMKKAHDAQNAARIAHTNAAAAYAAVSPHRAAHEAQADSHGRMADCVEKGWSK